MLHGKGEINDRHNSEHNSYSSHLRNLLYDLCETIQLIIERSTMKGIIDYFMTHPVPSVTVSSSTGDIITIQNPWYQPAMLEFINTPEALPNGE